MKTHARPAAMQRLPRLVWRDREVDVPVTVDDSAEYPALADDIAFLQNELIPAFVELDRVAQREQNRYRRQQLLLLLGTFSTTVFGAIQGAMADAAWPGTLVALTGAAVGALTFVARRRGSQTIHLSARLKAEQLRSLYFLYLGRVGDFADASQSKNLLISEVERIKHAGSHRDDRT